jgi:hypothetical protein
VKYSQWVVAVLAFCFYNGCGLEVSLVDHLVANGMIILQRSSTTSYINTDSGGYITCVVIMHNGFKIRQSLIVKLLVQA